MTIGKGKGGQYEALMHGQIDGSYSRATAAGVVPLVEGTFEINADGVPTSAPDFTPLTTNEVWTQFQPGELKVFVDGEALAA